MDPENTNNQTGGEAPQSVPPVAQNVPTPEPAAAPEPTPAPAPEPVAMPEPTPAPAQADPAPQVSSAMAGEPTVKDSKSTGPIVGSIIIIVIIILGGLYFWGKQLTNNDVELTGPNADEIATQEDDVLNELNSQGTSDELADIESDLDDTDLSDIDDELDDIDLDF